MARINLLPWRDQLREERKKQFLLMSLLAAVAGVGVWFGGMVIIDGMISSQNSRNQYLQTEIDALDQKIAKIQELESTKSKLISRMNVIQKLQQGRPMVVHLFEEMARAVPDGVFLSNIKQDEKKLIIQGKALSQSRVSAFSRNLETSEWLKNAVPDQIETSQDGHNRISSFTLNVEQTEPNEKPSDSESSDGGPS